MLHVAMLSKWHVHATEYAGYFNKMDDVKITCVWDEDPIRGKAWADEMGVDFEADLDTLLARKDVDAVCIDTPTNMHKDVMIKCAKAGKHMYTEKVMCLTVADCDEVIKAVEENNVIFTISLPQRTYPKFLYIKQAVESGLVGDVTVLRCRNCHDGALAGWLPDYWYDPETTGGGAMMDLGAHPMYLSAWMLGNPTRIQSMFNNKTGHAVEDNTISTIEFENGAIAVSETSLVSPMCPQIFEVYGTKGVILAIDNDIKIKTLDTQKHLADGWVVPKLPEALPHPTRQWVEAILYGGPVRYGVQEGRMLTALMENAYIADRERREVKF